VAAGLSPNSPTPNIAYTLVATSMTKKVFNTGFMDATRALRALSKVSPKCVVRSQSISQMDKLSLDIY
jgi:hypothetical protein